MSSDQKRDQPKPAGRLSPTVPVRRAVAAKTTQRYGHDGEFEAPTRPRARTLEDSEPSASVQPEAESLRPTQDSIYPVRVASRSSRPPLSLWARAWATAAIIIVMVGGAVGIVAGLRARALSMNRTGPDRSQVAAAAAPPPRQAEGTTIGIKALPAAAPGLNAPPPALPAPAAPRANAASSTGANVVTSTSVASNEALPPALAVSAAPPRPPPGPVAYRTLDSLAVSPPPPSPVAAAPSPQRRPKPAESPPRPRAVSGPPDEHKVRSTEAPGTSDLPGTKADSEAWITEERRF